MTRNSQLPRLLEKRRDLLADLWTEWVPDGDYPIPEVVDDLRSESVENIREPDPEWESYLTPLGQQIFSELKKVDEEIGEEEAREHREEVAIAADTYYHH